MEPKGPTDIAIRNRNYNIKPAQVVDANTSDDDIDFPEFEFPVSNGVSTLDAWKAVSTGEQAVQTVNGNSTWGFLQPGGLFSDDSPKKMPLAFRSKNADTVPEPNPFFPSLISELPTTNPKPQVLSPLATFKNLDVSLDNGKVGVVEEKSPTVPSAPIVKSSGTNPKVTNDSAAAAAVPSTPTRKSLSAASRVASDSAAPPSTPVAKSLSKLQADLARTPERVKSGTLSALSGKTSGVVRSFPLTTPRGRDEPTRPLSPSPDRSLRSLSSPRRLTPERSRSPVPFQTPDRVNSGVSRSLSPSPRSITPSRSPLRSPSTPRSISPVPTRTPSSNPPKEQWNGSTARPALTPNSPRYITPTRAASLKAVKTPATPNAAVAKELQYTPVIEKPTPRSDPVKKAPKEPHAKISDDGYLTLKVRTSPPLTQPSGFNFKTDERSEKRRDFYTKLEERMKAKEEERKRQEAKAQEEKEAQLKELRKSLRYKANPVPKFYQEPPPPPVEIKKVPPTRARSPNFTAPRRRDSCMGSFSESTSTSSGGSASPMRSRLVRSPSLESNSGSHSSREVNHSHSAKISPKVKQPFKPI